MKIEIHCSSWDKILKRMNKQPDLAHKGAKLAIAKLYTVIIKNINKGIDATGVGFPPYSKGYIQMRLKEGLGKIVNLQWHSDMVNSISISNTNDKEFLIAASGTDRDGVSNSKKLYDLQMGLVNGKKYQVLIWSKKYKQKMFRDISNYIRKSF